MNQRQYALFQDMRLQLADAAEIAGAPICIIDCGLWTDDQDGKTRLYVEGETAGIAVFLQGSKVIPSFLYDAPSFTLPILERLLLHPPIRGRGSVQ